MKSGIKECVKSYALKSGCSLTEADKAMRTAIEVIKGEILNNGGVIFMGDFSIEVVHKDSRKGVNPVTGDPIVIPARKTLKLVVGKKMKEELNK